MSELKVYHHELRHNEYEEFYLKYEADKEIQRLEKLCENYRCDCDNLGIMTDILKKNGRSLRQKMNHQKYKRCMAMARWCDAEMYAYPSFGTESHKEKWWQKWHNRWLELADKFKEMK